MTLLDLISRLLSRCITLDAVAVEGVDVWLEHKEGLGLNAGAPPFAPPRPRRFPVALPLLPSSSLLPVVRCWCVCVRACVMRLERGGGLRAGALARNIRNAKARQAGLPEEPPRAEAESALAVLRVFGIMDKADKVGAHRRRVGGQEVGRGWWREARHPPPHPLLSLSHTHKYTTALGGRIGALVIRPPKAPRVLRLPQTLASTLSLSLPLTRVCAHIAALGGQRKSMPANCPACSVESRQWRTRCVSCVSCVFPTQRMCFLPFFQGVGGLDEANNVWGVGGGGW